MDCKKTDSPIVSIITPCYNNGLTISETINSVKAQSYPLWELICVDDGSTDDTIDIIGHYCDTDNRIRLIIREKNPKGGSHCRNIGAFAAQGDFLIFLDGDDVLAPTCIENRLKRIVGTENEFVVFPMGRFINNDLNNLVFNGTKLNKHRDYLYYFASGNAGWAITSPIIRTSFFKHIGGYNLSFLRLQDIEYNLRSIVLSGGNYRIMFDSDFDCYYRVGTKRRGMEISSSFVQKSKNAQLSYEKLLNLVLSLDERMPFSNKKRLSKAILNIYCNGHIQYGIVVMEKKRFSSPVWMKNVAIPDQVGPCDKFIIWILNQILIFPRLDYLIARIISKIIRKTFVL